MQVHLAPDATVRADRPHHALWPEDLLRRKALFRHHLEDRPGGTDPDALAAPGAAGPVGVAIGPDDDLGVLTAEADIQDADDLDILARPDAAGAEDTGGHVVADHRIAGTLVAGPQGQVPAHDRGGHDVVLHDIALELVARAGAAAVAQVLGRVALQQQPQHALAILDCGVRLGGHAHPVRDLRRAGGHELRLPVHRDEANAAIAHGRELRIPAQGGDLDPRSAGDVQDRLVDRAGKRPAVDSDRRHEE